MEAIDREHVQLGHTGHAKLGQTVDDTLGSVENGSAAPAAGGFDGVGKKISDDDLYDDDGKPRRTGQSLMVSLALESSLYIMLQTFTGTFLSKFTAMELYNLSLNGKSRYFATRACKVEDALCGLAAF